MSNQHFFAAHSVESDLVPWSYIAKADCIFIRLCDGLYSIHVDTPDESGLIFDYATREEAEAALRRLQHEYTKYQKKSDEGWYWALVGFFLILTLGVRAFTIYVSNSNGRTNELQAPLPFV